MKGPRMASISLNINGADVTADVEGRTLLVELLRETLGLTGTHVGCDTSQCGACVVHVDGEAVNSCLMLAGQADGRDVTTIEGLATRDRFHPIQEAFEKENKTPYYEILFCEGAWKHFEECNIEKFAQVISDQVCARIENIANPGPIVLAQASMMAAAPLLMDKELPVLTSPIVAVRTAISRIG